MTEFEQFWLKINDRARILSLSNSKAVSKVIDNSISFTYSLPQYESTKIICKNTNEGSKVLVLASWTSLILLEMLHQDGKTKEVTLLDHDRSVISVGDQIQSFYPNMNIKYIRKNVVFDDISEYLIDPDVIVIPSINMLLPFDELLPNLKKDTLVSITGTSNMKMRYGNPIYNFKSQVTCNEILFAKQYNSSWGVNNVPNMFKFITSVVVARI
jgi:hypothetical protein